MPDPDGGAEIELKFRVPAARLPALERALATKTAERVALRATYHDTTDGALAAAQMVLRVRFEGDRWVQALKGRGDGLMQRLEHEVPLPAAAAAPAPDPALHAGTPAGRALAGLLQGRPLQPVHGTDILRLKRVLHHRGARIEAALDRGELLAGERRAPVCELELELLSGPVAALLDLATRWAPRFGLVLDPATKSERAQWLRAGLAAPPVARAEAAALPPAGAGLAAARAAMLAAALAQALPNAAALAAGQGGPEHLHQLRVALRRLRSVLRALGPEDAGRDEALARLFGAFGGRRDQDVLPQTLAPARAAAAAAGLPAPADPPPPAALDPAPLLNAPQTTALWLGLLALTQPEAGDGGPWLPAVCDRLHRWRRAARRQAVDWTALDDTARHGLRKRIKRLRYLLELALPVLPPRRAARELAALRRLQEALGHWNDLLLARAALPAPADPAAAFVAGWLAREAVAADRDCAEAAAAWCTARSGLQLKPAGRRKPR